MRHLAIGKAYAVLFSVVHAKRVNVDFPLWMIAGLDDEASRLGINRQAVIKTWVAERLDARVSA